jgi:type IV pilus assembly protein PilM
MPLFNKTKNFLGIDIGTFSTKMVELSYSKKGKITLVNYAEKANSPEMEEIFRSPRKKSFSLDHKQIAANVKKVLDDAEVKKREAVFSIPDFMTFFTVFKTPPMPEEEIGATIQFEARQHIPLPLKDVTLDWSVIEKGNEKEKIGSKVLLVAVPNKVINEYQQVAQLAGIDLLSIEAEAFSLARASVSSQDVGKTIQLIDIGVQSTTISIVKDGSIKATYSIDFSEIEMIKALAVKSSMSYTQARQTKDQVGFKKDSEQSKALCEQLDVLVNEIKQIADNLFRTEKKEINKVVLSGGSSLIPGLREYIEVGTKKETKIIDPFLEFSYPLTLKEALKEMGPRYAIATGLALRGRE